MPKYTYTYFPVKALGEAPRLLMVYGGQDFEDVRVSPENWPELKPKTPFGQMPLIQIDGKVYAQSNAISRYLGRKYGVNGATPEQDLEIDQVVDFINDIRAKAATVHYEQDEAAKAKRHAEFTKDVYPALLNKFSDIIAKNNGHVALGKLTWGDFIFAGMFDYLKAMLQDPQLEKKYPNFKKVVDNVENLPKVKEYVAKRPQTPF